MKAGYTVSPHSPPHLLFVYSIATLISVHIGQILLGNNEKVLLTMEARIIDSEVFDLWYRQHIE